MAIGPKFSRMNGSDCLDVRTCVNRNNGGGLKRSLPTSRIVLEYTNYITQSNMVLLTPYQLYILKALPNEKEPEKEVDLNDFSIDFGFLHRKIAETAFERSLRKIIELDQTTDD
ncbi:unnamed protein product [Mucor hiemalis]